MFHVFLQAINSKRASPDSARKSTCHFSCNTPNTQFSAILRALDRATMRPSLYAHPTLSSGTRCAAEDDLCRRLHTLEPKLPIAPDWTAGINNTCLLQDGHAGNVCLPSIHILGGWHSFVNSALSPLLSAHPSLMLKGRAGGACFEDWEDNEAQARSAPSLALPRPPSPRPPSPRPP